jgi:hypothetical protein
MGNGSVSYIIEENLLSYEMKKLLWNNGFHINFAHIRVEENKRVAMARISYNINNKTQERLLKEVLPSSKLEVLSI